MHSLTEAMSFIQNMSTEQWIVLTGILDFAWNIGKYLLDSGDAPPSKSIPTVITIKFKFDLTIVKW